MGESRKDSWTHERPHGKPVVEVKDDDQWPPISVGKLRANDLTPDQQELLKAKILSMRLSRDGRVPWEEIANQLNLSTATVRRWGNEALIQFAGPEEIATLKGEHRARYQELLAAHWANAKRDVKSAELILRILKDEQALFGIAAAKKFHVQLEEGGDSARRQVEAIVDLLTQTQEEKAELEEQTGIVDAELVDDDEDEG